MYKKTKRCNIASICNALLSYFQGRDYSNGVHRFELEVLGKDKFSVYLRVFRGPENPKTDQPFDPVADFAYPRFLFESSEFVPLYLERFPSPIPFTPSEDEEIEN